MIPIIAQQACDEIVEHIGKQGGSPSTWYCGIASDWDKRLFTEHKVPREHHWYIVRQCHTNEDARAVERALCQYSCDGGPGGGDYTTVYVYAYLKGSMTDP